MKRSVGTGLVLVGGSVLIGGPITGDMAWLPRVHPVAGAPPSTGQNHWSTDPVGYLLIAFVWSMIVLAGVIGIVKARRERAGR